MKDSSEGAFLLHLNRAATRTNNPLNLQHLLAGQVHLDFGGADVCVPSWHCDHKFDSLWLGQIV